MKIFWIKTTKTSTVVLLMIFFSMLLPYTATAQGTGFTPPAGGSPAAAILQFYNFAFLTAGALALLMTIFGIIRYGASGGIASAKSEGKSYIANAFGGLLLLLLAFLLLFTINPGLTVLSFPSLIPLPEPEIDGGGGGGSPPPPSEGDCTVPPLSPLNADAQAIENGSRVIFSSSDPQVNSNLVKLRRELNKMEEVIRSQGNTMTINSAYRPIAYQKHLWEIWDRWNNHGLKNNTNEDCSGLRAGIEAELVQHSLQNTSTVAPPNGCAPHVKGIAADLTLNISYDSINGLMAAEGIDIRWRNIPGDRNHFELQSPPFTGCVSG